MAKIELRIEEQLLTKIVKEQVVNMGFVKVTRCKDCAYYISRDNRCGRTGRYFTFEDDYCSEAERSDGGEK